MGSRKSVEPGNPQTQVFPAGRPRNLPPIRNPWLPCSPGRRPGGASGQRSRLNETVHRDDIRSTAKPANSKIRKDHGAGVRRQKTGCGRRRFPNRRPLRKEPDRICQQNPLRRDRVRHGVVPQNESLIPLDYLSVRTKGESSEGLAKVGKRPFSKFVHAIVFPSIRAVRKFAGPLFCVVRRRSKPRTGDCRART